MDAATTKPFEDDPGYRAGVVDLLGVLGLGELTAFERLAADAGLAPTLADKAELASMAVAEFHQFERIRVRLEELGVTADEAMAPFRAPYEAFHAKTAPSDWYEGLVKAYVGDGIGLDFYREIAATVDDDTRVLVLEVLADNGNSDFVVERVRSAIEADPRLGGRLALWGRRLVGEALVQAQRVAADRDALAALIVGDVDRPGMDLAELGRVFARLTDNHAKRMANLGLSS
ncbi:MAG: ferritin-like fold-containing protein [Jiangellaceae bacterium]